MKNTQQELLHGGGGGWEKKQQAIQAGGRRREKTAGESRWKEVRAAKSCGWLEDRTIGGVEE